MLRFDKQDHAQMFLDHMREIMEELGNVKQIEEDFAMMGEGGDTAMGAQEDSGSVSNNSTQSFIQWVIDPGEPYSMHAWLGQTWNAGTGVVVAALDSCISAAVTDVFQSIGDGYDFISDPEMSLDGDGRDGDWRDPGDAVPGGCERSSWHGTLTATMLACDPSRTESGYTGIVPNATVMPVRVLGACKTGYASDVADAIVWAAGGEIRGLETRPPKQVHVILMSFSGYSGEARCPSYLQSAVNLAVSRNITLVASGGNNYNGTVSNYFPANCLGVLSAGALNRKGGFASYTNRDASLYLPGGDDADPLLCMMDGKKLQTCTGTSFAAVYAVGWAVSMVAEKGWFHIPRWEGEAIDSYTLLLNRSNASFSLNHSLIGQDAGTECWNPYGNNGYYPYGGYGQDFYLKKVGYNGEWRQCTANSCRWGKRPVSQNSVFNNYYMDEWCACKPGYFASSASFLASLAGCYDNGDARPVGYCYQDPAAYDNIACSGCPVEHYCPGEATLSAKWLWWNMQIL